MKKQLSLMLAAVSAGSAFGAATLLPLTGFGGADGWLAPGENAYTFLGTSALERGLAYNPDSGNLLLASRNGGPFARVLNPSTGAEVGALDMTGVGGGTFAINMINVAEDGAIYAGNLSTADNMNLKIYRWADEASAPTVAYDGLTGLARAGDSFAVTGMGVGTRIVAAGSNTVNASNYASFTSADGLSFTSTAVTSVAGTATANNDYRLGLTFIDSDNFIGTQGGVGRLTNFAGVVQVNIPLEPNQRLLDYTLIGGVPVLAVADSATSVVTVLDMTTPSAPTVLASGTTTSGTLIGNGNAVGSVQWGAISGNSAVLYAMATNQGIQAFTFTIPEPTTVALAGLGLLGLLRRRR